MDKLQMLKAAGPPVSYLEIDSARDDFEAALENLERLRSLGEEIEEGLPALETAIDRGRATAQAGASPSATAQLQRAEELLASTRLICQPALQFAESELSAGRETANRHLVELDAMDRAQREANRRNSVCDIHNIGERSFEYPRSIWLYQVDIRKPMFTADNGGYEPHSPLYADLDGNGRIEAIVQLTKGSTTVPAGDCNWRGKSSIFVFEMDAKCVVHRLAELKGTAGERLRIKGKTLLVDRPYFTFTDRKPGAPCKESGVGHFAWQFKAGQLVPMESRVVTID